MISDRAHVVGGDDYIELRRISHGAPSGDDAAQRTARHLQKCLVALDKIRSIAGSGPIADLAHHAMLDKPLHVGGTSLDG